MNNTKFLLRFAMWTITLVLLDSCVADDNLVDSKQDDIARIEQINTVKEWYKRQTVTPGAKTRTVDDLLASQYRPSYSGEPSWDYFAVNKNDTMTVVDVDLTDRIGQDYVTEENLAAYRTTNNQNFRRSYTRLVYTKNHKTNKEQGFLMTIIPSKYYAKTYSNRLRRNTYLHRDKYLAGYVLFHNLDGKFANGWEYKKGKVIAKIRMPKSQIDAAGKKRLLLSYISASYLVKPKLHTPAQTRSGSEDDWDWDGGELPEVDIWGDGSTWLDEVVVTPEPPLPDIEMPSDWPPVIEYPDDKWPDYGDPDGGSEGGYNPPAVNPIKGEHYQAAIDDKFVIGKLPSTMSKQFPNTCVTSIMEYINNIFGGNKDINFFNDDYRNIYNLIVLFEGVQLQHINDFVNRHFVLSPFVSCQHSIDNGEVVMTNIPSAATNSTHNVVIIGYHTNGTLIYMDPEVGRLQEAWPNFFSATYIFSVSGNK